MSAAVEDEFEDLSVNEANPASFGDTEAAAAAAAKKAEANRKKREKAKAKKQAAKAVLTTFTMNADEFLLTPPTRVETWFAAYQSAFAAEHEWMEARKQPTSRGMGLGATAMLPLIFQDEPGTGLNRVSFFARYGTEGDAVGYATFDVDPDPSKVCHLRMLLVPPECQRQGIGIALLKAIVLNHPTRDIGLKYAKCHDYHKLYASVGFKKIGTDDFYIYMALRRHKT